MTARADAIVVLGCALHEGAPSPALLRRVEHGVALFARGDAPILILSGGGARGKAEAEAMRDVAAARGVPERAMLLEKRSRNTFENAVETARLMRAHGLTSLVLVSDGYHLPRARLLFRKIGLTVVATEHPSERGFARELPLRLREILAVALSLLRLLWSAGRQRSRSGGRNQ